VLIIGALELRVEKTGDVDFHVIPNFCLKYIPGQWNRNEVGTSHIWRPQSFKATLLPARNLRGVEWVKTELKPSVIGWVSLIT